MEKLHEIVLFCTVGDKGGFALNLSGIGQGLELLVDAIYLAGFYSLEVIVSTETLFQISVMLKQGCCVRGSEKNQKENKPFNKGVE